MWVGYTSALFLGPCCLTRGWIFSIFPHGMPPVSCGNVSLLDDQHLPAFCKCPTWIQRSLNGGSYLPNEWVIHGDFKLYLANVQVWNFTISVCCRWSPQIVVSYIHLPAQPDTCHPFCLILDSNRTWLTAWIESVYWWLLMYIIVKASCRLCPQSKLLIAALPTPSCRLKPPVAIPESPSHRIIWTSRSTWITSLLGAVLDLISLTSTILWC